MDDELRDLNDELSALDRLKDLIPDSVEFTDEHGSSIERYNETNKDAIAGTMPHGHITGVTMGFARLPHNKKAKELFGTEIFAFIRFGINGEQLPIAFAEEVEQMKVWAYELVRQLDEFDEGDVNWDPDRITA